MANKEPETEIERHMRRCQRNPEEVVRFKDLVSMQNDIDAHAGESAGKSLPASTGLPAAASPAGATRAGGKKRR